MKVGDVLKSNLNRVKRFLYDKKKSFAPEHTLIFQVTSERIEFSNSSRENVL